MVFAIYLQRNSGLRNRGWATNHNFGKIREDAWSALYMCVCGHAHILCDGCKCIHAYACGWDVISDYAGESFSRRPDLLMLVTLCFLN